MIEKVYSVFELTDNIKQLIESHFPSITVEGEISNYKRQLGGHIFFSLNSANSYKSRHASSLLSNDLSVSEQVRHDSIRNHNSAKISAVILKNIAVNLNREFSNGDKVVVQGKLSLYKPSGRSQIMVNSIKLLGVGETRIELEKLENKLREEGLFDARHKKEIPKFSRRIGVITSPTGVAIQDIVSVINHKYPIAEVILYPVAVQGPGAACEIAEAIDNFNLYGKIDVIIVGRCGGSAESLSAFNEEIVARTIFKSKIPIVSAVGHEADHSLSDLVADLQVATISLAAERVVPDKKELVSDVNQKVTLLYYHIENMIENKREHTKNLVKNYAFNQPFDIIQMYRQKINRCVDMLEINIHHKVELYKQRVESLHKRLSSIKPNSTNLNN